MKTKKESRTYHQKVVRRAFQNGDHILDGRVRQRRVAVNQPLEHRSRMAEYELVRRNFNVLVGEMETHVG